MSRGSVYDWVREWADSMGLDGEQVLDVLKENAGSPQQAILAIRETPMYKERFAGNFARAKAGFGMLPESQYIALESQYREAYRMAGMPEGYYDSPKDFADLIAGDVSPAEVQARANLAGELAVTKDPALFKELQSRGLSKGDIAAYMMDPEKSLPLLERKVERAKMGAIARDSGMGFAKGNKFENKLVGKGITPDAAKAAFEVAADKASDVNALARIHGGGRNADDVKGFSDKSLVKQELGIGGKKMRREKQRLKGLASQERAAFGGQAGAASQAFGNSDY